MKKGLILTLFVWLNATFALDIKDFGTDLYLKKLKNKYAKNEYKAYMLDEEVPYTSAQAQVVNAAIGLLGIRYRFGGETVNGMDCSSFTQKVYRIAGIELPRTARYQAQLGVKVSRDELKPGDLLFFQTYAKFPSHVGIYIGNGQMIHASSAHKSITISRIDKPYYKRRFLFAKRLFLFNPKVALKSSKKVEHGKN